VQGRCQWEGCTKWPLPGNKFCAHHRKSDEELKKSATLDAIQIEKFERLAETTPAQVVELHRKSVANSEEQRKSLMQTALEEEAKMAEDGGSIFVAASLTPEAIIAELLEATRSGGLDVTTLGKSFNIEPVVKQTGNTAATIAAKWFSIDDDQCKPASR
jgi:hypothetical protein